MVKESSLQQFLADYTEIIYDNIWLGSKYDEQAEEFKWDDGDPLTFTNWQDGYPRNITHSDSCIELRPSDGKAVNAGKWADATCQKRNLVMCQKALSWSLQDAVNEIIKLRKQQEESNARIVPIGSTYVEYSNQPSPTTLWPSLTWKDVTDEYAGLFFRAYGGGSAAEWGATQSDCSPRITQMQYGARPDDQFPHVIDIPSSGWSPLGIAGGYHPYAAPAIWFEALQYFTEGCEVRPKNQAIRIWKRIS